jgi:exopolyphosphatase/guanosine-5'-triphosphate,3'-diphosphate pyrophosphatase
MSDIRAAVDIGTNSMRLLVVSGEGVELARLQRVTGLGKGVDAARRFDPAAVARTLAVLAGFGGRMRELGVTRARAVATSACRDADDREEFFDRAEAALGVRPELIDGLEEAELAYTGATGLRGSGERALVSDIGGGSTEFVWAEAGEVRAVSVDIGSVRLTDRLLPDRPAAFAELEAAARHVASLFAAAGAPEGAGTVVGVAGTWTSLAALHQELPAYDRARVEGAVIDRLGLDRLVERLAGLTVEETAALPSLDPARAPVILAGAVVAREVLRRLAAGEAVVSEHDLLDGVVATL